MSLGKFKSRPQDHLTPTSIATVKRKKNVISLGEDEEKLKVLMGV